MPAPTYTRLTMIRGSVETSLSDKTVLFETPDGPVSMYYIADDGLGIAPLTRFSERGPSQHGDTDLGFLLEPRIVTYIFAIHAPATADSRHLDTARMWLIKRFRPSRDPVSLRYNRANGDVLQIDGHFNGGMHFGSSEREPHTWFQRFSVEFKMSDPTWYHPVVQETTLDHGSSTDASTFHLSILYGASLGPISEARGMEVATPVPTFIGASSFHSSIEIVYDGSWDSYPQLRLYGPLKNPIITHLEFDLAIPLLANGGAQIDAHDYWDITLEGIKTITNSSGENRMAYLSDPNHLHLFRLAADPDVPAGVNTIKLQAENTDGSTSMDITYRKRYIGI